MNEHLLGLYAYTLPLHQGFMHVLLSLVCIYLFLTQFGINNKNYSLRIRYFLPIYHAFLAAIFFTGLVLLSVLNFIVNLHVLKMVLGIFALIALSTIGYKRLKRYQREENLVKFRRFALFKGIADISILIFAGFK
ncbi:hypothetical protein CCAL12920_07210 [Campylobacter sp. RM12920]|uniref:Uncharacterized protein n=2 Tax=Campylobacter californiensis TaxID=1032243 RepID=A0ABD4JJX9_9BACT|nr:hypothetical protein [Campylobacter sp. RM12919]MBE2988670.1 hypothetical protein [Campylobacter sp. RM12920]